MVFQTGLVAMAFKPDFGALQGKLLPPATLHPQGSVCPVRQALAAQNMKFSRTLNALFAGANDYWFAK
jgi:hypothetical protein